MLFAPGCLFWPSFCRSLPWSQLCRISENARCGSLWQIWHSSAPRAVWEARFAAKCCARLAILVRTWWHSRQGVFSGLLFAGVCPGPNFAEFQNTRTGGPLGKFDIARLHGHFGRRGLQQNVVLGWQFKEMQNRRWWRSRQGVFSGLLFAGVCPGPNFAEVQETRAGGPLGKFDIARLHWHFGRRGLQQNFVLGWHFTEVLIRT